MVMADITVTPEFMALLGVMVGLIMCQVLITVSTRKKTRRIRSTRKTRKTKINIKKVTAQAAMESESLV